MLQSKCSNHEVTVGEDKQSGAIVDISDPEEFERYHGKEHLICLACGWKVHPQKTSKGNRFLYHEGNGESRVAAGALTEAECEESLQHAALKAWCCRRLTELGFDACVEHTVPLGSPTGDARSRRPDVQGVRGEYRVAVEVQWSCLSKADAVERTRDLEGEGYAVLWLTRRSDWDGVPALRIKNFDPVLATESRADSYEVESGLLSWDPDRGLMQRRQEVDLVHVLDALARRWLFYGETVPESHDGRVLPMEGWAPSSDWVEQARRCSDELVGVRSELVGLKGQHARTMTRLHHVSTQLEVVTQVRIDQDQRVLQLGGDLKRSRLNAEESTRFANDLEDQRNTLQDEVVILKHELEDLNQEREALRRKAALAAELCDWASECITWRDSVLGVARRRFATIGAVRDLEPPPLCDQPELERRATEAGLSAEGLQLRPTEPRRTKDWTQVRAWAHGVQRERHGSRDWFAISRADREVRAERAERGRPAPPRRAHAHVLSLSLLVALLVAVLSLFVPHGLVIATVLLAGAFAFLMSSIVRSTIDLSDCRGGRLRLVKGAGSFDAVGVVELDGWSYLPRQGPQACSARRSADDLAVTALLWADLNNTHLIAAAASDRLREAYRLAGFTEPQTHLIKVMWWSRLVTRLNGQEPGLVRLPRSGDPTQQWRAAREHLASATTGSDERQPTRDTTGGAEQPA